MSAKKMSAWDDPHIHWLTPQELDVARLAADTQRVLQRERIGRRHSSLAGEHRFADCAQKKFINE